MRNVHQSFEHGLLAGLAFSGLSLVTGGWWFRDPMPARAGHERIVKLGRLLSGRAPRSRVPVNPAKIDRQLTFDRLTNVHYSGTRHAEDQPVAPDRPRHRHLPHALPGRVRQSVPALLSRQRLRDGRRRRRHEATADQRVELRPLQDVRHHGSVSNHRLGSARGRRGAELRRHVARIGRAETVSDGSPKY